MVLPHIKRAMNHAKGSTLIWRHGGHLGGREPWMRSVEAVLIAAPDSMISSTE
jgi:hypothetical protein